MVFWMRIGKLLCFYKYIKRLLLGSIEKNEKNKQNKQTNKQKTKNKKKQKQNKQTNKTFKWTEKINK